MTNKGVMSKIYTEIYHSSLCFCFLQHTETITQNNKWYHEIYATLLPPHIAAMMPLCLLLHSPWPV
jgi:hypothetical protein